MPVDKETSGSVRATREKNIPAKGESLTCETCGLSVLIDNVSNHVAFEKLICCGAPMTLKSSPQKKPSVAGKTRGRQAGSSRY
jgi:hypothetical protein